MHGLCRGSWRSTVPAVREPGSAAPAAGQLLGLAAPSCVLASAGATVEGTGRQPGGPTGQAALGGQLVRSATGEAAAPWDGAPTGAAVPAGWARGLPAPGAGRCRSVPLLWPLARRLSAATALAIRSSRRWTAGERFVPLACGV